MIDHEWRVTCECGAVWACEGDNCRHDVERWVEDEGWRRRPGDGEWCCPEYPECSPSASNRCSVCHTPDSDGCECDELPDFGTPYPDAWSTHHELRDLLTTIRDDSDRIRAFRLLNEATSPGATLTEDQRRDLRAMAALREHHIEITRTLAWGHTWWSASLPGSKVGKLGKDPAKAILSTLGGDE